MNRASKSNIIYGAIAAVALLLLAPYFGLGALFGGRTHDAEPVPVRRRVVGSDGLESIRRRSAEEPRKAQKSPAPSDSALSDIEAMLGDRRGSADTEEDQ